MSKPYLTVSRYDYLLTVINGIALRLPFLTVISGVWRFNETTRCEADATTHVLAVVYLYGYGTDGFYYLAVRYSRRCQEVASTVCSRDA